MVFTVVPITNTEAEGTATCLGSNYCRIRWQEISLKTALLLYHGTGTLLKYKNKSENLRFFNHPRQLSLRRALRRVSRVVLGAAAGFVCLSLIINIEGIANAAIFRNTYSIFFKQFD